MIKKNMEVKYNNITKYFEFTLNERKLFITEEQIFFIIGEFEKNFLDKERIDFILKRTDAKFKQEEKEFILDFLYDFKNRNIILKEIDKIIKNIKEIRKDFPPKGLSIDQIQLEILNINTQFNDIKDLFTIDFCKIDFKEENFNIPENKKWLESKYIESMEKADILSKDVEHKNKVNIFVFTRYSEEYGAEHTFFIMKIGDDYFQIEPAGEASRGYGKIKPDGSCVNLDEMRNLLMMKKILNKNPEAKLFFKMTGSQADRINCSIFTLDFAKSLCFQLRECVQSGIENPQEAISTRLKKFFSIRMNEELRIATKKEYEGAQLYHEGDIDVMQTYYLDYFKVLSDESREQIETIRKNKLNIQIQNEMVKQIMNDDNSYKNIPNDLKLEKREEFLPPELIINSQINSMIIKNLSLSQKTAEQTILTDTTDGDKKTLREVIEKHKIEKDIVLSDLTTKTLKSSDRISKIREGIIGK